MLRNLISLHLNKYNSVEELARVLKDNDLNYLDPVKVFQDKESGFTKIFFDRESGKIIGWVHKSDKRHIFFDEDFVFYLKNLKSITPKESSKPLSLDEILDKINEKGIDSLTQSEKIFLESQSNK